MHPTLACCVALLLLSVSCATQPRPATTRPTQFKDLGVQITSMTIQGSTFAKHPDGRDLVCTVIRGQPAKLLVFDVKTGALLHRLSLQGAHGAWNATTASDGSVYVGSDDNGHLYRWIPGEAEAKDLGQVAKDQKFSWDVVGGADGEVFVSTWPGCMVVRYHPKDGFKDVGKGAVAAGEDYVRGVTYDADSGRVFVGVGTKAHLIELDPKTGAKRDILPAKYKEKKFVYSVEATAGKLLGLVPEAETIVFDLKSGEVEATLPDAVAQLVVSAKSPSEDRFYYNVANGKLGWYDLKTREHGIAAEGMGAILAMRWGDKTLAVFTRGGGLIMFDPATKAKTKVAIDVPPEPTPIHYIARGPDDRIYSGGYLSGGLAIFDPATGKSEQFKYLPQTEGITKLGKTMYYGGYPDARIYRHDPSLPWDGSKGNPKLLDTLDRVGQDRPFAAIGVEALNKVFFGTVPDYGALGGALVAIDGKTDAVEVYRDVVPEQSVVSLAYAGGMVVGGTAIRGGLGIDPKATEAKVFLWDPATKKVAYECVPVPKAQLVTGLMELNGNILGIADGTLFVFDVAKRQVVRTKKLWEIVGERKSGWRNAFLTMHPSGQIYGTALERFFRLDPKSLEVEVLSKTDIGSIALDAAGRVYFRKGANLWQFTP